MSEANAKSADLSALRIDRESKNSAPGRKKKWLYLLWVLVPIALFLGYKTLLERAVPAVTVQVATAQLVTGSEASAELVATGYVVAQRKAAVSSKATGKTWPLTCKIRAASSIAFSCDPKVLVSATKKRFPKVVPSTPIPSEKR